MNKNRPVNLDLTTIRFPITAIVSISHRIAGVTLLGGILVLFWMFDASLRSPDSFRSLQDLLDNPLMKLVLWLILAALSFHVAFGIRHLIMDTGVGESMEGGRLGAKVAIAVAAVLTLAALGWVIW